MDLRDYCTFLARLTRIPVLVVDTPDVLEEHCRRVRFHKIQSYLYPDTLAEMLRKVEDNQIVKLNDDFQIHFLFGRVLGTAFIFGPFCCESLSTQDARVLLERCKISRKRAQDLLVYRSHFTIVAEKEAVRAVRIMVSLLSGLELLPFIRTIDLQSEPDYIEDDQPEHPYAETIRDRYAVETDMMRAIEHGNAHQALRDWRQLHQRMDYLKKQQGYSLDLSRESAAITRTVIRVAGMNAGLPPVILDQLTGETGKRNRLAKSLDEIENNTEALVLGVCREIRRRRKEGSSYLAESVKFHIESHFTDELTVSMVAEHLGVPESRLIELFRIETGTTPGVYLRKVRMTKAADLLTGTRWSVQKIASEVGVPDANYFVKLFKQEFGKTPTSYRKTMGGRENKKEA
ncbi:MAG: helix-turn-helix transcriptional regulator [Lachnospiraceae bacterium]|nr:helix-turn-helix transcriptional regulator [Lachnospiraceae bacterium]